MGKALIYASAVVPNITVEAIRQLRESTPMYFMQLTLPAACMWHWSVQDILFVPSRFLPFTLIDKAKQVSNARMYA